MEQPIVICTSVTNSTGAVTPSVLLCTVVQKIESGVGEGRAGAHPEILELLYSEKNKKTEQKQKQKPTPIPGL